MTGSFPINTVAHSRTLLFTITASDASSSQTAQLTALGDAVASVSLSPSTVVGGQNSNGSITLLSPAPAFGWTVHLVASDPTYVSVPNSVTLAAGARTVTFPIKTVAHGRTLSNTITASDQTSTESVSLTTLGDAVSSLSVLPESIKPGQIAGGTVTLAAPAPAWGWTVNLSSSGGPVFTPASITIPAGATKGVFTILTNFAGSTATITASDQTSSQKQTLNVGSGFWLAGSAWPKFRGSLENQGQGLGQGANGTLKWKFATGGAVWSSPTLSHGRTIYVGSDDHNLYSFNRDGSLYWKFMTEGPVRSSAAVGSDETVYVGAGNSLYAISFFGNLVWKFTTPGPIGTSSPTIQSNGTISIGSTSGFYEINHDGTLKYHWPSGNYEISGSPALSGSSLYSGVLSGVDDLFSFGPGSVNWSFPLPVQGSVAVGSDQTVYAGSSLLPTNAFHAIFPNGKSDWRYNVSGAIESGPAVGADGTVYVASTAELYAFNSSGTLKWTNSTGGSHGSSPCIGSDGTIYVGMAQGSSHNGLYAFNPNGTLRWMFPTQNLVYSSPAIDADGSLYFGCLDGNVYAMSGLDFQNSGFESPIISSGSWEYSPPASSFAWTGRPYKDVTLSGGFGVTNGNSPWGTGAVAGSQYAFLQGSNTVSNYIEQTVSGFTIGETYQVTFSMARRREYPGSPVTSVPIRLTANGKEIFPSTSPTDDYQWNKYQSASFTATQSSYTLVCSAAIVQEDDTTLLDEVHVGLD